MLRNDGRTRSIMLIGHFATALALNTTQPLYPLLKTSLNLSVLEISLLPTILTVTVLLANILAGIIIGRIGQRRLFFAAMAGMTIAMFGVFFARGFVQIALAFAILGVSVGWTFTSLTTIYSGLPINLQNFGLYHSLFGLGGAVSPLLLSIVVSNNVEYQWLFFGYAFMLFLIVVGAFFSKSIPDAERFSSSAALSGLGKSPLVIWALLVMGAYAAAEIGGSNLSGIMHIEGYERDGVFAGFMLTGFWLAFSATRLISDLAAKKLGSVRFLMISLLSGFLVMLLWTLGVWEGFFVLAGASFGPVFPVIQKYMNLRLPPDQRGAFNGFTYGATGLAATIFMPVMGSLGDIRIEYAFIPALILLVLAVIFLFPVSRSAGKTSTGHP